MYFTVSAPFFRICNRGHHDINPCQVCVAVPTTISPSFYMINGVSVAIGSRLAIGVPVCSKQ